MDGVDVPSLWSVEVVIKVIKAKRIKICYWIRIHCHYYTNPMDHKEIKAFFDEIRAFICFCLQMIFHVQITQANPQFVVELINGLVYH